MSKSIIDLMAKVPEKIQFRTVCNHVDSLLEYTKANTLNEQDTYKYLGSRNHSVAEGKQHKKELLEKLNRAKANATELLSTIEAQIEHISELPE